MRRICTTVLATTVAFLSGCARSPAESFGMVGFRGQRVVFVSDSSEISIKEEAPPLLETPLFPKDGSPEILVRQAAGQALYEWGATCRSQFVPKRVSWDPRMGLSKASDGWNVGDPAYLLAYTKSTNTDYIVVLNKVSVKRSQVKQPGIALAKRPLYAEVSLDISVIDAKDGKRVWRSPAVGRFDSNDSLARLVPKALELAVDNFYSSLPQVHRWGCQELVDRFK